MKKIESISMKTLGFSAKQIRKIVEDKGEAVLLGRIVGIVDSYFTGENANGEWVGFKGHFRAKSSSGEDVYHSTTAFIPSGVANPLREALDQGQIEIEVKADIFAIESDKNASGYAYLCEPILTNDGEAKMKKLDDLLSKNMPLLSVAKNSTDKVKKVA